MKAIILSAGQGRRLLPLTARIPKCLVEVCGRTLLEWQLRALAGAAIKVVTVVVGFGADDVERHIIERAPAGMDARTLVNPLWNRADNLVSCLAARGEMTEDFLLINGDTLFEPAVVTRLCASRGNPVSLAIASKALYDDDDMKVLRDAGRVTRIGKDLPIDRVGGEAIGMSLYRGAGPQLLRAALEEVARRTRGGSLLVSVRCRQARQPRPRPCRVGGRSRLGRDRLSTRPGAGGGADLALGCRWTIPRARCRKPTPSRPDHRAAAQVRIGDAALLDGVDIESGAGGRQVYGTRAQAEAHAQQRREVCQ